jgi:hypothetical protein
MATANVTVGADWVLVAAAALDPFLLTTPDSIEVAVTADDATAPTVVRGHAVGGSLGLARYMIGDGAVWARKTGAATATVVVT